MAKANRNARVLVPFRHEKKLTAYQDAIRAAGMEPVPAFVGGTVALNGAVGMLLLGGTDVNPKRYGETARPETDEPDDQRDEVELRLIEEALERDLPILAICRGLQILNVYHGGSLIQHLSAVKTHDVEAEDKGAQAHEVAIKANTRLAHIAETERWRVNSRHHQAADKIGAHLRVSARAVDDGTIEALERPDRRFVVAVQWHPEDQVRRDPEQLKLFRAFADAVLDS
ncbi:MAG TPA: gamma-glutamyl-gamma-aminobutyrate hydrolase family protein [Bryobacteraceae bacterium]|nr:gamma-glutamyl-gamma-aminobutyrate hydrolase family protein [Bryobacteraceae bacterium]